MDKPLRIVALAPFVVLAHFVEEWFGFVEWFNRHAEPDLTDRGFFSLTAVALVVTASLAAAGMRWREYHLGLALIAWLSFLMLANGSLHIAASFMFNEYVPGAITSVVFYLPYFFIATVAICRRFEVQMRAAFIVAALGAAPMLVQGLGVILDGRRLLW